jgi:ectoine hydroxylase-related dioxygenase (phytanoyl-CoA dioxygenase family)
MYISRIEADLGDLPRILGEDGIARVPDIYTADEIAAINAVMDPFFQKKSAERRAYVWPDDMMELGIFETILSHSLKNVLFSIMPDPVIYHMLSSEIAGSNTKSHVFGDLPGGWHRDPDCSYFPKDPTHVSIFVYLTDVGPGNGCFELVPRLPHAPLESDSPVVSMMGRRGTSFVWHRSFYHRAAPNTSAQRRRIIKLSIQRNEFPSMHLRQDYFRRTLAEVPRGDARTDVLLGRYQGKQAPLLSPGKVVVPSRVVAQSIVGVLKGKAVAPDTKTGAGPGPRPYAPRDNSEFGPLPRALAQDGIARVPDIYAVAELAEINAALNPAFKEKSGEARSYVLPDDMVKLGILEKILSPSMQDVLFSVMPDPVIYHLLASEIAGGNSRSHIFAEKPGGWHRDPDAAYIPGDPTHVSLFVYLSRVGPNDGALELAPQDPTTTLRPESAVISMAGGAGLSFLWHRSFYYREAPNSGPRRRRVIKISIQRNEFPSANLKQPAYASAFKTLPAGDARLDVLLGRFQGGPGPSLSPVTQVIPQLLAPISSVGLTTKDIK